MPDSETAGNAPVACPYLGLVGDARTHFSFISTGHRCHSPTDESHVDATTQRTWCLTARHVECPRYRPIPAAALSELAAQIRVRPGGAVARSPAAEPTGRRRLAMMAVLIAATAAVAFVLGPGLAGTAVPDPTGRQVARSLPTASSAPATRSASPAPTSAPTATPTKAPTATPTKAPTASPTSPPTAAPTPPRRSPSPAPTSPFYTVRAGDTLFEIAQSHGVTVEAMQEANGIEDPDVIRTGARLVIPRP